MKRTACDGPVVWVSAAQGRMRPAVRSGNRDPRPWVGHRSRRLPHEYAEFLLDDRHCAHPGMGGHRAITSRSACARAPRLLASVCRGSRRGQRGLDVLRAPRRCLLLPRPRSARHAHGWRGRGTDCGRVAIRLDRIRVGFLEGDGPAHKPAHAVVGFQGSKAFRTQWTVIATALNLGDTHFLLDESNTFGGTHSNNPQAVLRRAAVSLSLLEWAVLTRCM